ncbi:MAG TPA: MBL fold metallo-hydrolase [Campylobacterales bacterium]|nr:MBL fold metallo-hydrolase [Campylobacterales bacterium]
MLKYLSATFTLSLLLSTPIFADATPTHLATPNHGDTFDYKLQPTKVSDNIWCFLGALEGPTKENAGNMVNSCYVQTKDSFVVIDSGPSYEFARQAYEAMNTTVANLPVKTVITTHDHDDHWLGNSYFKKEMKAQIIGPQYINDHYKVGEETRMFRVLPKNAIKGTEIVKVDKVPTEGLSFSEGGEKFEIVPIGTKAHSVEDYFVYMPQRKALFAGDVAMNGRITSNRDGSLLGQLKAIEMMRAKEWDVFIPGHGLDTSKKGLDEAEKYFTLLHKRILEAIDNDVELTDITTEVTMNEFKDHAMFDVLNARNVSDAFTEMEFAEE